MVFDGEGPASFAGEVLVEGERIVEVAKGRDAIAAERAAEIDRRRRHDVDAGHGRGPLPPLLRRHRDQQGARRDPGRGASDAHLRNAKLLLDHGFTSAFSAASAKMRLDVVVRHEIEAGIFAGPRYVPPAPRSPSPAASATRTLAASCRPRASASSPTGPRRSARPCACAVRENVDNIKFNISGDEFVGHARAEITSMTEPEIKAAVETAHDCGKRVACHSRAAESVKRAVRHGVDCIYHCDFADEEALDMLEAAKDRVFIGPAAGLVHNSVFEGDVVGLTREIAEKMGLPRKLEHTKATYHEMRKRGMRVVIGGDYGFSITPMGQNARDIGHFVKFFGYSPAEALQCATAVGGDLLGQRARSASSKERSPTPAGRRRPPAGRQDDGRQGPVRRHHARRALPQAQCGTSRSLRHAAE